jgi:hypothetical protein
MYPHGPRCLRTPSHHNSSSLSASPITCLLYPFNLPTSRITTIPTPNQCHCVVRVNLLRCNVPTRTPSFTQKGPASSCKWSPYQTWYVESTSGLCPSLKKVGVCVERTPQSSCLIRLKTSSAQQGCKRELHDVAPIAPPLCIFMHST